MTYDDIVRYYKENVPQGPDQPGTDAWNDRFNSWTSQIEKELGIPGGDFNDPSSGWSGIKPAQLDDFEIQGGGSPATTVPLEQGLLSTVLPGLISNINADPARQQLAETLQKNATSDYNNTRGVIGTATDGGQFDWQAYVANDPGLVTALDQLIQQGHGTNRSEAAKYHYDTWGKAEGRQPFYTTSTRLGQENAQADVTSGALASSAKTAASSQLAALQNSVGQLQGNLQGELAARAAALQQQIASLNQNLDQYDATQRSALAQQIAQEQADLEKAVASQKESLGAQLASLNEAAGTQASAQQQALQTELDSLGAATDAQSTARKAALQAQITALNATAKQQAADKRASLQQEIAALGAATDTQSTARKAALQQQLTALDEASSAQAQSKRQALETEISGLNAAQAPMSAARIASAEALGTAINLGLEKTKDQLQAEQAKNGYLGGSTMSDSNLARAVIGARQEAAQALSGAKLGNAADVRSIADRSATEGRSITDELSGNKYQSSLYGAGENRSLSDELANSKLAIANRSATGERAISDQLADNTAATGAYGANEGRGLEDELSNNRLAIAQTGATGTKSIADQLAAARASIAAGGANDTRALSDKLATGTQSIADKNAASTAAITNSTGLGKFNVGNSGATATYGDALYGAGTGRSIADALAKGTYDVSTNLATQLQGATNQGTMAKQNYFDNDFTRGLALSAQLPSLTNGLASTTNALAGLGTSGLNSALNTLNWWGSNATPSPLATSNPTPDNSGTGIGNLGAGLTGAALQLGNANKWWQTPAPAATTPTLATNLGGSLAICWIAREVFGESDGRWQKFRTWLLSKAPAALRNYYIANGERLAADLRHLPSMKAEFATVMNRIMETA